MGGIVGYGCYQIKDCIAQGATLTNHSTNIEKCYVGGICGLYNNKSGFWAQGTYFEPQSSGMINCKTSGIVFDTTSNVKTGELTKIEADEDDGMFGVFGFIGTIPNSKLFEGIIDMDARGYIITDENMNTNIPGVYAAGDVRVKSLRQVVTAAADGAIAATQVERGISGYL
jgi:hypothetical protein